MDAHVNIFPERIVTNTEKNCNIRQRKCYWHYNAGIRSGMNKANVDASVLHSVATYPDR